MWVSADASPCSDFTERLLLVGHYAVRPGHIVYVNDSSIFAPPSGRNLSLAQQLLYSRDPELDLRFFSTPGITPGSSPSLEPPEFDVVVNAHSAFFGADLSTAAVNNVTAQRLKSPEGHRVYQDPENEDGCAAYADAYPGGVLLARRGGCTFVEKLRNARAASAVAVIVISDDDAPINPTSSDEDLEAMGELDDVALLLLTHTSGNALLQVIDAIESQGVSKVMVALEGTRTPPDTSPGHEPQPDSSTDESVDAPPVNDTDRVLYINGHALLNTRLLV